MQAPIATRPVRVAPEIPAGRQERLRALALEQIYRIRRFKLHLAVFAAGLPALSILWVVTEYFEEDTWPSRFASDPDVAGTWDPWLFFVAGIWFIALVVHALRTYLGPPIGPVGRYIRRPVSEEEIDREVARIEARG
jgi:hypothetical protein